jgi:bZIP Maf transcription factor
MTSKEIEDYVADLKSKRNLTVAEEKDLKRQRRLVKNREYASQSRSRKKQFVDDLEKQLEVARAEAAEYKKQNQVLTEENKLLKRQLGSIAETIKKSQLNAGGSAAKSNLSSSSGSVGVFDKFVKIGAGRNSATSKGVSACLLAIFFMVFTFATFWDNDAQFSKNGYVPSSFLLPPSFASIADVYFSAVLYTITQRHTASCSRWIATLQGFGKLPLLSSVNLGTLLLLIYPLGMTPTLSLSPPIPHSSVPPQAVHPPHHHHPPHSPQPQAQ